MVAIQGTDEVAIVDLDSGDGSERFDSGTRPDGLCLSPERDYLAVISNADAPAQIHSTDNWAKALVVSTAEGPGACLWLSEVD